MKVFNFTKKMNVKTFLVTLAVVGLSVSSLMAQTADVYVGGYDNGKATVWKNGMPQYLANKGEIYSVVVNNGNVYAAGYESVSGMGIAKVWKNGTELYASNTNSHYSSIAVSESGVVYVTCIEEVSGQWVGRVWKDGVVETGYTGASWLSSIFIDGSDIYAAGYTADNNAAVWKNGTLLYTLSSGGLDVATSVFVFEGDVYTTGNEYVNRIPQFKVWKNNATLYTYNTSGVGSLGSSIYISNGVIYASGLHQQYDEYQNYVYIATLWTDGIATELASGTDGRYTEGRSVFVYGSDVYVAGANWDPVYPPVTNKSDAMLWVNGTATTLSTGDSYANSVFVVEAVTGITDVERNATVQVYPNPTTGQLMIESGNLQVDKVEIYDIAGKIILTSHATMINISQFSAGTYFVKLKTGKGELTKKVIKE